MNKKIKILVLADTIFSASGVAIETRQIIDSWLASGKFEVVMLGGAMKHPHYRPMKYKEGCIVYPVDEFGTPEVVRSIIRKERPDMLWHMTDPRYFYWLFQIADEILPLMPWAYYHVWDNFPVPKFNAPYYNSCSKVITISELTHECVKQASPNVPVERLAHVCDPEFFHSITKEEKLAYRKQFLPKGYEDRFVFFWNNRNARRKQASSLLYAYKEFSERVGKDKTCFLMHTNPLDPNGPNLYYLLDEYGLNKGEVLFSTNSTMNSADIGKLTAMCDCTVSISDAEGFGKSINEALACGNPVVVNMTGGMQEQVYDKENDKWCGIGIEPKAIVKVGQGEVPLINEDHVIHEDVVSALMEIYNTSPEKMLEYRENALNHVDKHYNFAYYNQRWVELMEELYEMNGSWETRKNYKGWETKNV